jgi:hypothetical protein
LCSSSQLIGVQLIVRFEEEEEEEEEERFEVEQFNVLV